MSKLRIIGNGHCREIVYWQELTDSEREDLDWASEDETFFRYKGNVYALSEFMRISKNAPEPMQDFDGYMSDSFFSGILVRYPCRNDWHTVERSDHVQVYWYMS